jgi:hypothetical protein
MAHPDLQAFVDSLLPFAKSRLSEYGEFHPFGAKMASNGEIQWIAADVGEEFPPGQLLIDTMTEVLREMAAAGEIRAGAICYDCRTTPPGEIAKTDAVAFSLEHLLGESISLFLPYVNRGAGVVQYGNMFATQKRAEIFSQSPNSLQ